MFGFITSRVFERKVDQALNVRRGDWDCVIFASYRN